MITTEENTKTYIATPDYGVGTCVWITINGTTHVYYGEPEKYWKRDRLELTVPTGVTAGAGLFDYVDDTDVDIEIGGAFIKEGGSNDTPPGAVHVSWETSVSLWSLLAARSSRTAGSHSASAATPSSTKTTKTDRRVTGPLVPVMRQVGHKPGPFVPHSIPVWLAGLHCSHDLLPSDHCPDGRRDRRLSQP